MPNQPLLDVAHLTVQYESGGRCTTAIDNLSFSIAPAEIVGVAGASGCGKTTTALSMLGLLPATARVSGSIRFEERDLLRMPEHELRRIRGAAMAIVFQEPGPALNPVMTVGAQIAAVVRAHERCSRAAARRRALEAMADARLGDALPGIYAAYPHELSGGQCQRVVIAQALACRPSLVIADEPTASLDSTVRAEVLRLIAALRDRYQTAFLLISHSPAVLASVADRVMTFADGRLKPAPARPTFVPCPATVGDRGRRGQGPCPDPLLTARGVTKFYRCQRWFGDRRASTPALSEVDLSVPAGARLGLIGESGAGKSTLARCLAGLEAIDAGAVCLEGRDIARLRGQPLAAHRCQVQLIHQDSASAFNPRLTAEAIVAEPLVIQGIGTRRERQTRALDLMAAVGLEPARAASRPGDFSGGERQRLALARALAIGPRAMILDEPFSGLDAASRERIIDLLEDLQRRHRLTYVCISHDLGLMTAFTSDLAVMYRGRVVEHGPTARLLTAPQHPHTRALVAAAFVAPASAALAG